MKTIMTKIVYCFKMGFRELELTGFWQGPISDSSTDFSLNKKVISLKMCKNFNEWLLWILHSYVIIWIEDEEPR